MLAFSFLIALLLLLTYSVEGTLNLNNGIAQQLPAISTNGWARTLPTLATQLARPSYEVSLNGRIADFYSDAETHQILRQNSQLSLNMNPLADIFGADSDEALIYGHLNAAEVFSQEDFDPTPEDLGKCPYGDDTVLEALMADI